MPQPIKSFLPSCRVILIAMTGYASPGDQLAAEEAGLDERLVKPMDLDTLRKWLRRRV